MQMYMRPTAYFEKDGPGKGEPQRSVQQATHAATEPAARLVRSDCGSAFVVTNVHHNERFAPPVAYWQEKADQGSGWWAKMQLAINEQKRRCGVA